MPELHVHCEAASVFINGLHLVNGLCVFRVYRKFACVEHLVDEGHVLGVVVDYFLLEVLRTFLVEVADALGAFSGLECPVEVLRIDDPLGVSWQWHRNLHLQRPKLSRQSGG